MLGFRHKLILGATAFVLLGGNLSSQSNESGPPPVLLAVLFDSPETLEGLLADGAVLNPMDGQGKTALHLAAEFNPDPRMIQFLLEKGLSVGSRDNEGRTPLMLAALRNTGPVVEALWKAGANPQDRDLKGRTAYQYASGDLGSFNRKLVGTPLLSRLYEAQYRRVSP